MGFELSIWCPVGAVYDLSITHNSRAVDYWLRLFALVCDGDTHGALAIASSSSISICFWSFRNSLILLRHSWATSLLTVLVVLLPSMKPVQR